MEKEEIKSLVEQAKNNSERAFSRLYNYYNRIIWITIFNIVKNKDVTDDLLSIVFVKAYEKLSYYVEHISFEMWLKTIAMNTAIDYIRRTKKEKLNDYVDDEDCTIQLSSSEESPEDLMITKEKLTLAQKAMTTLQEKYRNLINFRVEGKSYKEISQILACSEDKVKSDLNKARRRLKRKLQKNYKQLLKS